MPVYYVITKTGNRHEIEAPNVRTATIKAEHEFGPQNIATAPQESMKKPATDRASLHRALDAVRASCPVCLETVRTYKCGSGMCLTSHDVKGKECAGTNRRVDFAKDRATLHRALDKVLDNAE